jgi:hypothetical protein
VEAAVVWPLCEGAVLPARYQTPKWSMATHSSPAGRRALASGAVCHPSPMRGNDQCRTQHRMIARPQHH